jgi:hypothetical protein
MHFPATFDAGKPATAQRFLQRAPLWAMFVYLWAKFEALNPGINNIRFDGN